MRLSAGLRKAAVALYIGALVAIALLMVNVGTRAPEWPILAVLGMMAACAEMLPVQIARYGLRLTLTLPFVAAIAVLCGPLAAIGTELAASGIASFVHWIHRRDRLDPFWFGVNASAAVISAAVGWVSCSWLIGRPALATGVFALAYGVCNMGIVMGLGSRKRWSHTHRASGSPSLALLAAAVMAVLSVPVVLLISDGSLWAVPVLLVPVVGIRTAVAMRVQMMEHYDETIVALTLMLQRAHPYTHGHLERVARLTEKVALRLGLGRQRARLVRAAAILHDIGKIAIDEEILEKPAKLDAAEMDHIRKHSEYGAIILSQSEQFRPIVEWIRYHHERPDGQGYPENLTDVEIPVESKIIAVADAFDAMVGGILSGEKRPYREPMTVPEALAELDRCSGTQFDRAVVHAFRDLVLEAGI